MIRLFCIEDHPIIITGLRNLFRPSRDGIEVTCSAPNVAEEDINNIINDSFDIILLDLWLSDTAPIQNVKILKQKFPGKPIVMFTSESSPVWQRKMFEAGVSGYLFKTAEKPEILETLNNVYEGKIVYPSNHFSESLESILQLKNSKIQLTPNQLEIVILLSNGITQQKIAEAKKTSISNIVKTLVHIRKLFEARNNAELIKFLLEFGII